MLEEFSAVCGLSWFESGALMSNLSSVNEDHSSTYSDDSSREMASPTLAPQAFDETIVASNVVGELPKMNATPVWAPVQSAEFPFPSAHDSEMQDLLIMKTPKFADLVLETIDPKRDWISVQHLAAQIGHKIGRAHV